MQQTICPLTHSAKKEAAGNQATRGDLLKRQYSDSATRVSPSTNSPQILPAFTILKT